MTDLREHSFLYSYEGKLWNLSLHASDEADARRRVHAALANGEVARSITVRSPLPPSVMWLPLWLLVTVMNFGARVKRWWGVRP